MPIVARRVYDSTASVTTSSSLRYPCSQQEHILPYAPGVAPCHTNGSTPRVVNHTAACCNHHGLRTTVSPSTKPPAGKLYAPVGGVSGGIVADIVPDSMPVAAARCVDDGGGIDASRRDQGRSAATGTHLESRHCTER
jgi:hypothetical protein